MNETVQSGYDKIADSYHSRRLEKVETTRQYFESLRDYFPGCGKLLDLGCGGGQPVTAYFAGKGYDVTGVDISPKMIEIAKKEIPSGKFMAVDMVDCGFEPNEFDLIVSAFAIIHVPQERQKLLFGKIYQWLKSGGAAWLTLGHENREELIKEDWYGAKMYWSYFSPETYREIIHKLGFKLVWAELEMLQNGETFYNVILKK